LKIQKEEQNVAFDKTKEYVFIKCIKKEKKSIKRIENCMASRAAMINRLKLINRLMK